MSIPKSGGFLRSAGVISKITKELKSVTFKPVKKMTVQFDPFHENAKNTRQFMFFVTAPHVVATNLSCVMKTNIVCDRSEPIVTFDLESGEKFLFKCNNLTTVDILQLYNKHISSLVPKEKPAEGELVKKKKKRRR
ncbi:39S ribosomal protein L53, mitochondrial [Orussus abietinus]|uniref:39S ribosomal protein L53, mitochondrial n=1 Tax=Orussus abietinus TaxID=222816 RepID=UPI000625D98B|nr:39S ribosomal protein L53, mitochondrial [Orussus abietinus]